MKRIGLCAIGSARMLGVFKGEDGFETTIVVPESVEEIGFDEEHEYSYTGVILKAPKGSYAIKFAKEHKIKYIEI